MPTPTTTAKRCGRFVVGGARSCAAQTRGHLSGLASVSARVHAVCWSLDRERGLRTGASLQIMVTLGTLSALLVTAWQEEMEDDTADIEAELGIEVDRSDDHGARLWCPPGRLDLDAHIECSMTALLTR